MKGQIILQFIVEKTNIFLNELTENVKLSIRRSDRYLRDESPSNIEFYTWTDCLFSYNILDRGSSNQNLNAFQLQPHYTTVTFSGAKRSNKPWTHLWICAGSCYKPPFFHTWVPEKYLGSFCRGEIWVEQELLKSITSSE